MNFKKIKVTKHIQSVAKARGISYEECRRDMEIAIKEASKKPSPLFIKTFGNRTPDLEEVICKLLEMVYEEERKKRTGYDA